MTGPLVFDRAGARLSGLDFGGTGSPVLLLHGLAGHAGEWSETAGWLHETHRVIALDARGHGASERRPEDVSAAAQVADVAYVIEGLALGAVLLVGQSLGGLTALTVAAQHPGLVRALVLVDAFPGDGHTSAAEANDDDARSVSDALRRWPVPFASQRAATDFFRGCFGSELAAQAWTAGLEHAADGWRPRFDVDVLAATLRAWHALSTWAAWESIHCPVLVVRAGGGLLSAKLAQEMLTRLPHAQLCELREARHDLHLDRPAEWRAALSEFVESLE